VYRLELDDRVWAIQTGAGQIDIQPGEPARADASMATDPETLNALLYEPAGLDAAVANGRLVTQGDLAAVRRLLQAVILTPAE
jgi:hypothetical protein